MCISIVRFALYRPYNDMWTHVVHVHVAPGSPPHPQAFYCKIYCVLLAQQYGHMYVHINGWVCVCVYSCVVYVSSVYMSAMCVGLVCVSVSYVDCLV